MSLLFLFYQCWTKQSAETDRYLLSSCHCTPVPSPRPSIRLQECKVFTEVLLEI